MDMLLGVCYGNYVKSHCAFVEIRLGLQGNDTVSGTEKGRSRLSLLSRTTMACLALPASFIFYRTLFDWLRALAGGRRFFVAIFNRPNQIYARLAGVPRLFVVPILLPLSIALQIRRFGGVFACAAACTGVVRREGLVGIGRRIGRWLLMPTKQAKRKSMSNRVLVMDYRIPMADVSAGERTTVGILRDFRELGFEVVLLPADLRPSNKYAAVLQDIGVTVITTEDGYGSPIDYLSEHASSFSVFYLCRIEVALTVLDTIRVGAPEAKVIFHAPDLYHLREEREADLKNDEALRVMANETKRRELELIQRVDHTVLLSRAEHEILSHELPNTTFSVFHGLYATALSEVPHFGSRRDIFFLGGFSHAPNVDAVCWFTTAIWPLIRESLPDVTFHIVGSEAPPVVCDLARHRGVNVVGFVADLTTLLATMRLGVAPLRYGAGIKGKVATTMGAGIPCVCTTIAAEGMYFEGELRACIGDDPVEFSRHVVRLYSRQDEWERMSTIGKQNVELHFSEQANRAGFARVLGDSGVALPVKKSIWHRHISASRWNKS